MKKSLFFAAALGVVGCHNNDSGKTGDGDSGATPAPMATHVSGEGTVGGLQTAGKKAAYLFNLAPAMKGTTLIGLAGELHVVTSDAKDTKVADNVLAGEYALSPDGSAIFWVGFDFSTGPTTGASSINYLSLATAGAAPKVLSATGGVVVDNGGGLGHNYAPYPFGALSVFSPSGKYFTTGVAPSADALPDLHVYEVASGNDVYDEPNGGAAVYSRIILPDDTMVFANAAAGATPDAPPLQNVYWVKLGGSAGAASIATRAAQFATTNDNKTVIILRTNGDLLTWSVGSSGQASAPIATNVATFSVGGDGNGPVLYVAGDRSLHIVTTDGSKKLDLDAATANADVLGTPQLSPDGKDVYFWQSVSQQNNQGTLFHVPAGGGTPNKVADAASLLDLAVSSSTMVLIDGVDGLGQLGTAAWGPLDGSKLTPLGSKAAVGGLRVASSSNASWLAMHLNGAVVDSNSDHTPIDGSAAISGALAFDDAMGTETTLDSQVHTSAYAFSASGFSAVYAIQSVYDSTAFNWAGNLRFIDTKAPGTPIDGKVTGVSEIGPVSGRQLFVAAPTGTPAGVYFLTY